MSDIFISYAREDAGTTERLAAVLEGRGWTVFWDRRIPIGVRYDTFIAERLTEARAVVALWSRHAVVSAWVVDEAAAAAARGVLLPALLAPVDLPLGLRRINAADLSGWDGAPEHSGLLRLLADVARLLDGEAAAPPAPAPPAPAQAASRPTLERIDGRWQGDVAYPWGVRRTETFTFRTFGRTLTGTAGFLGVPRPIAEGEIDEASIRFVTRTREQAGGEEREAIRRYFGERQGGTIALMLITEGGFSAHEPVEFSLRRDG
jgi:hypothetical protein